MDRISLLAIGLMVALAAVPPAQSKQDIAESTFVYDTFPDASMVATNTSQARVKQCKRPELAWETWRRHVLRNNSGTYFFELLGDGRQEILSAYKCIERSDRCPPNQLMVFFGVRNRMVLLAFVKDKCVTFAKDILVQEFLRLTRGAADIASRITDVCFGANTGHAKVGLSIRCVKRPLIDQSRQGAHRASVHKCATIGLNAEGRLASSVNPLGPQKRTLDCKGSATNHANFSDVAKRAYRMRIVASRRLCSSL